MNINKYIDRLTSKKEELAQIQFKFNETDELLYETKFYGVIDDEDQHTISNKHEKLKEKATVKKKEIERLEEAVQKLKNIFNNEDDEESEGESDEEDDDESECESDDETIIEVIDLEEERRQEAEQKQKDPTEFSNIDDLVKDYVKKNYKHANNKHERIEPSNIRDNFNKYKKSKNLKNDDISTQAINKIMAELGYKKIKSHGKWYYENIVKYN